jgi:hypothetical protein
MDEAERLSDLISYAQFAVADDMPFEVTGDDLRLVLEALKGLADQT